MILSLYKKYWKLTTIIIVIFFVAFVLSRGLIFRKDSLEYGVTFSQKQAIDLGLDWQDLYKKIFSDLGVKKIRLAAYWDEIEEQENSYNFKDLEWQLKIAEENEAEVILAVGGRLPRWPECHFPDWADKLSEEEREKSILKYIEATLNRYKNRNVISAWQVENEPFLKHFGECPEFRKEFLDQEIQLVKSLDHRPIVVTDSGELSMWIPAAKRADIFGTTMYRDTYSQLLKAYVHYPIEPGFFRAKKNISSWFARPEKWVVIELQAEPWGPKPFQNLSQEDRGRTMNLQKFKEMIEFSSQTGFQEFYLWGVEWWYWEKEVLGNPELWEYGKTLFNFQ